MLQQNFFRTFNSRPEKCFPSTSSYQEYHSIIGGSESLKLWIKATSVEDDCKTVSSVEEVRSLQVNVEELNHLLEIELFLIVQLKGFDGELDSHC